MAILEKVDIHWTEKCMANSAKQYYLAPPRSPNSFNVRFLFYLLFFAICIWHLFLIPTLYEVWAIRCFT